MIGRGGLLSSFGQTTPQIDFCGDRRVGGSSSIERFSQRGSGHWRECCDSVCRFSVGRSKAKGTCRIASLEQFAARLSLARFGLAVLILLFPAEAGSRIAFYAETLNPDSSAYAGENRAWDYPIGQLEIAFQRPNWVMGNGIGTASIGMQYVARALGQAQPDLWVEEGYGVMIVEMGIIAPFLWILWTAALLYYSWKIVQQLKGTRLRPYCHRYFLVRLFFALCTHL